MKLNVSRIYQVNLNADKQLSDDGICLTTFLMNRRGTCINSVITDNVMQLCKKEPFVNLELKSEHLAAVIANSRIQRNQV